MLHLLIRKHCWPLARTVNQYLFMAFPATLSRGSPSWLWAQMYNCSISKQFVFNLWMLSLHRPNTIKFTCYFLPSGNFSINFLHFSLEPHKQVFYFLLQIICCYFVKVKKNNLFWGFSVNAVMNMWDLFCVLNYTGADLINTFHVWV